MSLGYLAAIVGGAVLGVLFVAFARTRGARATIVYAVGLIAAALVYVGFAAAGAPSLLPREVVGVALFGVAAGLGAWRWPLLIAVGWAAHVGWDVALHPAGAADGVPWWYPPLCIGFDLVVAAAALRRGHRAKPDAHSPA